MKALSIRQPWAYLIVAGIKPIENRTWLTHHRGPLAIHAGVHPARESIERIEQRFGIKIPREQLQFGGIVGTAELTGIVTTSSSPYFEGPYGWVMTKPRRCKFVPWRGLQSLFDVPADVIKPI